MLKEDLDRMIKQNEETRRFLTEEHRKTLAKMDGSFLARLLERFGLPPRNEIREKVQTSHTETIRTLEQAHAYLVKSRDFVEKHPDLYE